MAGDWLADWAIDPADREELRLATVLTGGVSLAVWMGGVGFELNRLLRARPPGGPTPGTAVDLLYARLADLVATDVSVDVLAGSSAGGINGALLALAVAHDADLDFVRDLWLDEGSLSGLLRPPTQRQPRSLLRGDEHFLPALRRAFAAVPAGSPVPGRARPDLTLLVTTTLLQAETRSVTDSYGTIIRDLDHHGTFTFTTRDLLAPDAADRLALAARCSASFPAAFEASFCPVLPVGSPGPDRAHPNMTGCVDATISRYTVDGGLLDNQPIGRALQAIFANPPQQPVRRVLGYVVPDPGGSTYGEADRVDAPPALGAVLLDSLLAIPHAQSISADLTRLRDHNSRVAGQRRLRGELLELGLACRDLDADRYTRYVELRADAAVSEFLGALTRELNGRFAAGLLPAAWQEAFAFASAAYADRRGALLAAARERLPAAFPADAAGLAAAVPGFGVPALERCGVVVLALARQAAALCRVPALRHERARLLETVRRVHGVLARLRATETSGTDAAGTTGTGLTGLTGLLRTRLAEVGPRAEADLGGWTTDCFTGWLDRADPDTLRGALDELATILLDVGARWRTVVPDLPDTLAVRRESDQLDGLLTDDPVELRLRLLRLEVLQVVVGVDAPAVEQVVDLMQISAETRSGLVPQRLPADKLTGLQLDHFGAFYKRSWRANDWLWGRYDAAGWLVYLLLHPGRLRAVGELVADDGGPAGFLDRLLTKLRDIAVGAGVLDWDQQTYLGELWARDLPAVRAELGYLAGGAGGGSDPVSLPVTSCAVARGLQYAILLEELPKLRDDLGLDLADGAAGTTTASWRARFDRAWEPSNGTRRRADVPVTLFRDCPVARETFADEVGSDLFTNTVATAVATGLNAATGASPALPGPLRGVLAPARAIGLVVYFLSRWALLHSKTAFAATMLSFTVGVLLAVLGHGAVRGAGTLLLAAVVVFLTLGSLRAARHRWRRLTTAAATVLGVLATGAIVTAPWYAGNLPARALRSLADGVVRHPTWYAVGVGLVILGVTVTLAGRISPARRAAPAGRRPH